MWYVLLKQDNGCDYTIECGTKMIALKAQTHEDALVECKRIIFGDKVNYKTDNDEYYGIENEDVHIDDATLFEVNQVCVLLDHLREWRMKD